MNNNYPTINAIAEQWVNIVLTQIEEKNKTPIQAMKQTRLIKKERRLKKK